MDSPILSQPIKFVPEYRAIIMKRLLFIFTFFCLLAIHGGAQNILTLENCLRIGIENNLSLQGKRKAMQKSKYGISENRVKLLPQINGFANFNDNIDPPVSVTDGSSYGVPYNITRTLQYSANAGIELQMPLYNQTLYTSISIAEIVDEMSRLSYEKAREDLILQISKMYYLGQVTAEQIALIKANITRLEELRDITQAFFDNGMAMEVDLKRVNINLENLKVQYDNAQAMMTQQLNMLKYIMDYPAEKEIGLFATTTPAAADTPNSSSQALTKSFNSNTDNPLITSMISCVVIYLLSFYIIGLLPGPSIRYPYRLCSTFPWIRFVSGHGN